MTLKLDPNGTGQEIRGMKEEKVEEGGECTRQKEDHTQRPRGEKGTECRTI